MKNTVCPECKQALPPHKKMCMCGWRIHEAQQADHYCQYCVASRRCKNLGTMCSAPYGSKWYCSSHFRVLGDARLCEAVLMESERNI